MSAFISDRRQFLGWATLSAGGVAVGTLLPASLLQAAPWCATPSLVYADACGDWTLDDMCLAYPPYAFRTGAAVAHTLPMQDVAPVDLNWVS